MSSVRWTTMWVSRRFALTIIAQLTGWYVVDVEKAVYTALSPTCEAVNIPADPENDEICRIICKVIS